MMTARRDHGRDAGGEGVGRSPGLEGAVVVSWAAAGGLLLGGFLTALLTLAGRLSGAGLIVTSTSLFVIGASLGLAHGTVLGALGRPPGLGWRRAIVHVATGLLYAIPALLLSWLVAGWMAMTVIALHVGRALPLIGVGLAWVAGCVIVGAAVVYGLRALRNAFLRWPDAGLGAAIVALSLGALLVTLLARDPAALWGFRVRLTPVGGVIFATLAAVWVVGPAVTLALALVRRLPSPAPLVAPPERGLGIGRLALGLLVGIALGLLALPFHTEPLAVPTLPIGGGIGHALLLAVGLALVDEVLLRLGLVTGLAWLVLRSGRVGRGEAVVVAVAAAALLQVALYLPGVLAIGFPSALAAAGYTLAAVLVPGLAFGFLYWYRGFAPAVVADAAALLALALLAA